MATLSFLEMSDLLYPGLHKIFIDNLKLQPNTWTEWMNVETSSRYSETDFSATGLGQFRQKPVGKPITYDTPLRRGTKTYTHATYALGYRVEEELVEDDLYGQIKKYPAMLSDSANHTINILAHQPLNFAFTDSAAYHGIDGKPLCSLTHPLTKAGGTQANTFSTAQEVSRTAIESALTSLRKTLTQEGRPAQLMPVGIIADPTLTPTIWDAIGNPKVPESNINANNWVATQSLKLIESDWLINTKWWFIVCKKSQHTLNWFWRVKLSFMNDTHFDTGDMRYRGRFRSSSGFTDFYGIWGTNPS